MKILISIIILTVAAFVVLMLRDTDSAITYTSEVYNFSCENGAVLSVQYDSAAEHARVRLSGVEHELTRTQAASGARYTNEATAAEFWEHQGEAVFTVGGARIVCSKESEASSQPDSQSDLIRVREPALGATVEAPLMLSGEARGYWFFEATAPVVVTDWDGRIIGESYITAEGDWMTEDFVPFTGTISYDLLADSYSASGTVMFRRHNASGLPEHDAAIEIPVLLKK